MKIHVYRFVFSIVFSFCINAKAETQFRVQSSSPKIFRVDGCQDSNLGMRMFYSNGNSIPQTSQKNGTQKMSVNCDRSREINYSFYNFLKNNFKSCFVRAVEDAKKMTLKRNASMTLVHVGISGDRRHTSTSWHSHLLAIDVKGVLLDSNYYGFSDKQQKSVFKKLRSCWAASITNYSRNMGKNCQVSTDAFPSGTIGEEDSNHRHHLHLSLPCSEDRLHKKVKFDDMDEA